MATRIQSINELPELHRRAIQAKLDREKHAAPPEGFNDRIVKALASADPFPTEVQGADPNAKWLKSNAAPKYARAAAKDRKPRAPRRDLEFDTQQVLVNRIKTLAMNDTRYAAAAHVFHSVPNGGHKLPKRTAGRLRATGLRAGVHDTFTPYRVPGFSGLYLEVKSLEGDNGTKEQREWLELMRAQGFQAVICKGADDCFDAWKAYVALGFA